MPEILDDLVEVGGTRHRKLHRDMANTVAGRVGLIVIDDELVDAAVRA